MVNMIVLEQIDQHTVEEFDETKVDNVVTMEVVGITILSARVEL